MARLLVCSAQRCPGRRRNCAKVAKGSALKTIAFPAISCGVYGYPYHKAADLAIRTLAEEAEGLAEVHFVLFEDAAWDAWQDAAEGLLPPAEDVEAAPAEAEAAPAPAEAGAATALAGETAANDSTAAGAAAAAGGGDASATTPPPAGTDDNKPAV